MSAESDLTSIALFANRLALHAFTPADAPEIFAAVSPAITRFMSWDPSPSLAAFAEVWRQWLARTTAGTDLSLVIRLRATGEFLGVAGVHRIGSAEPEVGIWLKETAHGLGYGREAIGAIVTWAPAHIGAAALIYPVAKQNRPSRRLAESLHATIVGERKLRKSSGVVLDEVVYRIPVATDRSETAERFTE
jgi:RimJ/RimL family protein N-acetyltransferase